MSEIVSALEQFLKKYRLQKIAIGLSGGIDSIVLLHALKKLEKNYKLKLYAIHINHNLQQKSLGWIMFCQKICEQLNIPIIIKNITNDLQKGQSIEAWAREKRYDAFKEILADINFNHIFLAHHKNDQAETLLLNLIRGSGLDGLASMPEVRNKKAYQIYRPFLSISRAQIETYAKKNRLQWIDDSSNDDTRFDRNFIRHEILNKINHRFNALDNFYTTTKNIQYSLDLLNTYLESDLNKLIDKKCLIFSKFIQYDLNHQIHLLRFWIKQNNILPPNRKEMLNLIQSLQQAKNNWQFNFNDHCLILYNNFIYLFKQTPILPDDFFIHWHGENLILKEYNFSISKNDLENLGLDLAKINWEKVTIRARKPKDRCQPIGRNKSNDLKIIFQEKSIPKFIRERTPLIIYQKQIIAVGKLFGCNQNT